MRKKKPRLRSPRRTKRGVGVIVGAPTHLSETGEDIIVHLNQTDHLRQVPPQFQRAYAALTVITQLALKIRQATLSGDGRVITTSTSLQGELGGSTSG